MAETRPPEATAAAASLGELTGAREGHAPQRSGAGPPVGQAAPVRVPVAPDAT